MLPIVHANCQALRDHPQVAATQPPLSRPLPPRARGGWRWLAIPIGLLAVFYAIVGFWGSGLMIGDQPRWRGLLKGIHDTEKSRRRILVTGSARLDHYRKGGDALVGRYRYFRLHPFSLRELAARAPSRSDLDALLTFGGFPEPLFAQSHTERRIWERDRLSRVVREDLRDLERVREVSLVEHLIDLLPARVGSARSSGCRRPGHRAAAWPESAVE